MPSDRYAPRPVTRRERLVDGMKWDVVADEFSLEAADEGGAPAGGGDRMSSLDALAVAHGAAAPPSVVALRRATIGDAARVLAWNNAP